jgi:hypothetical protein
LCRLYFEPGLVRLKDTGDGMLPSTWSRGSLEDTTESFFGVMNNDETRW